MKLYLLLFLILLAGCQAKNQTTDKDLIPKDTIISQSGLKYYYLKKGEGRKIEDGSKVTAYNKLYLSGSDTVFWSTDDSEDSAFSFVQGKTSLVKGALELYPLLREGDHLVAIMPPGIAYGDNDNRGLPGGSTLTFNPIIIKRVSEPKEMLGDTLYAVCQNGSSEDVLSLYNSINGTDAKNDYHMELGMLQSMMGNLVKDEQYETLEVLSKTFGEKATKEEDKQMFSYYLLLSAERQNKIDQAIIYANEFLANDPESTFLLNKIKELKARKTSKKGR